MIKYRKDIDGLRAFAVLPVVLYHANFSGLSGGFVGVDVFFVISGYLITQILIQEMEAGTYSLSNFYARRIRRILPALIGMIIFVLAASPFFLLPSEFSNLWKEALGTLFFVANIVYWRDSGYFSPDAEAKPLLHMWSLGIEEQFYIFAPLALWLALRYGRRYLPALILVSLAASLAACIVATERFASASFYLLPTRAWELLAGSFLASLRFPRPAIGDITGLRQALSWLGLVLLLSAVFFFDKNMAFPGYAAILPVAGTCLLIRFAEGTTVGKIFSWGPIVFIGLLSYSLYLWHWPLVVFSRDAGLLESVPGRLFVVALSILLAWASWRFIEKPTRDRHTFDSRKLTAFSLISVSLVCVVCAGYRMTDGWPSRVPADVAAFDAGRYDISPSREKCHVDSGLRSPQSSCVLGEGDKPHVAVWGDSHGVELAQALSELAPGVQAITYSSCPPERGNVERSYRPQCAAHNRQVLSYILGQPDIQSVVLVAYYKDAGRRISEMTSVAQELRDAGKRVVVVGPTPTLPSQEDLPSYLARGGTAIVPGKPEHERFAAAFKGIADTVMPEDIFCSSGSCSLVYNGTPILFDGHHPSMVASRATAARVIQFISPAPTASN